MLVQEVPVLPVLAKADCMTTAELESFREHVRTTLHHVSQIACMNKIDNHCQFLSCAHLQGTWLTSVPISPTVHVSLAWNQAAAQWQAVSHRKWRAFWAMLLLGISLFEDAYLVLQSLAGTAVLVGLVTLGISINIST